MGFQTAYCFNITWVLIWGWVLIWSYAISRFACPEITLSSDSWVLQNPPSNPDSRLPISKFPSSTPDSFFPISDFYLHKRSTPSVTFTGVGFSELRHIQIWATLIKLVLGDICLQFVLLDYFLGLVFSWSYAISGFGATLDKNWFLGTSVFNCSSWLLFAGVRFSWATPYLDLEPHWTIFLSLLRQMISKSEMTESHQCFW